MRPIRTLLIAAVTLVAGACGLNGTDRLTGQETSEMTLYVAPYTRTCTGEGVRECLLVRTEPDGEWLNFYDPIEGFTHQPGYAYTLEVGSRHIENPPADGSSRAYWLIRIVEQVAVR